MSELRRASRPAEIGSGSDAAPGRRAPAGFRLVRRVVLALALLGALAPAGRGEEGGSIHGQLFTAEHPDSVAAGAALTLIFRTTDGELHRIPSTAGPRGSYAFHGLATDPGIQYVIKVEHFGREYLGAPIAFAAGESQLSYNFLVARDAAPLPPMDGMAVHPPTTSATPALGTPVRQNPVTMIVIVATLLALFGLPIVSAARRDLRTHGASAGDTDAAAEGLIRDIAALDVRFERGELEEADYRAVRRSLLRRLREVTGVAAEESA